MAMSVGFMLGVVGEVLHRHREPPAVFTEYAASHCWSECTSVKCAAQLTVGVSWHFSAWSPAARRPVNLPLL
jgi:hypothetical protein